MFAGQEKWKNICALGFVVVTALVVLPLALSCAQAPATPEASADKRVVAETTPAPAAVAKDKPVAVKAAKPTGEVVIGLPNLGSEVFDPSKDRSVIRTYQAPAPLYESLYAHWPPDGEVRPFLLQSGEVAATGLSWTFKLRDGIRFSNGDAMTAEDVKFSLDRYRSKDSLTSLAGQFRESIKDVVVVDRLTVRVDLNEPMAALPIFLAGQTGNEGIVVPKAYIERVGWEEFERKPIGSGPYKLVEYKPGESVNFEAVENHWRWTPKFAKVSIVAVKEERSRVAMLQSGRADLIALSPENRKEIEQAGFKVIANPYASFIQINFYGAYSPYPAGPTSKLEVRKALNLAVDKKAILDALFAGAGDVSGLAPSVPGITIGAPKGLAPTPYDPAEAKRLLAQAGYPNGFEITFYSTPTPACSNVQPLVEAIASYWEKIGVKSNIRPIEFAVFRPMFAGKEHAPQIVGAAAPQCASTSIVAIRDLSTYYWSKGTVKLTNVVDAEIEKAATAKSPDELVQYSEAAYRKIYDNYAAVPLLHVANLYGASDKLADLPVTKGADALTNWLVQERP